MPKKVLNVSEITGGVLSKVVDLALVSLFYSLEFGFGGYGGTYKAGEKAMGDLADINYASIKRAISELRKKGLVQTFKRTATLPEITTEGKRRLRSIVPVYNKKRTWDGRVYLVTYDLPKEKNSQRNKLRTYLKKIGCGMLQESVWITPYNPKTLVEEFISEYRLEPDFVLVSSLGKGRTIGDLEIKELVEKVFKLHQLNQRYREFLVEVHHKDVTREQIVFKYLAILRNDPQIPFSLLPVRWLGGKAYEIFTTTKNSARAQKTVTLKQT